MFDYRPFQNDDPPTLTTVWNECFTGRGAYPLRNSAALERGAFSKPYFEREGMIVALDGRVRVGFVHAGFAANAAQTALDHSLGVISAIAVRPAYRRKGIGGELLRRAEAYLVARGARKVLAGAAKPNNPFYFGTYGGADSPGFLASDSVAEPFFRNFGYGATPQDITTKKVYQRRLDQPLVLGDPRSQNHRKKYDVAAQPRSGLVNWWQESVVGLIEPVEFRLEDRTTGAAAGRAVVWELEGFSWRWNTPAAGIMELTIRPDLRATGLGKFFLAQLLRYLQDQYFGICECHAEGTAGEKLLRSVGFDEVDHGMTYRKALPLPTSPT